ncbi:MAG: formylglycine-generating enzyme family protein [Bacteroidota bacterium]
MRIIFLISVFLGFQNVVSQKPFNPYSQKISGSELQIEMVSIKGGRFTMGSAENELDRSPDEGPQHQVRIDSFWMAQFEITWDIYNLFVERQIDHLQDKQEMGGEVSINVDAVAGATIPYVDMTNGMGVEGFPAVNMTQYAASKFCEWLSAMTGNFYRLPTEAEWEYACKAGTQTAYSFGNDTSQIDDFAWSIENSNGTSHKVGLKKPNPFGLYDMHGNVAEWTLDEYAPDTYVKRKKVDNPFEKPTKTYPKTVRGGSWSSSMEKLRSASRMASTKTWKARDPQIPKSKWWHTDAPFIGFRIVRPYHTPSENEQKLYWKEKHTKS